ncbi:MAG TPA: alpha/beta fold hydrolase [Kofleriaceae bacterium]|nr:alpha/beta fold hydrolase [Kofleriaceae bacterium]
MREKIELAVGRAQYHGLRRLLLAAVRARAGEVDVDGVRLPWIECGQGPPLLLVHGFGGDKESWLPLVRFLPRHRRVIAVDLPGHGAASPIAPAQASAAAQARVLAGLAARLGIDRTDVVGSSMGGGISLRLAADHPALVRALVLIGSAGPEVARSEVGAALDRGDNPLVPRAGGDPGQFMKTVMEKPLRLPRALQRYAMAERAARADSLAAIFGGWRNPAAGEEIPTGARLAAVRAPALILHGARDRVIHPATAEALATGLPHAQLVVLDGIGHVPQLEAPRRVARLIEEFLASVGGRDAAAHR